MDTLLAKHSKNLDYVQLNLIKDLIDSSSALLERGKTKKEIIENLTLVCSDKSLIHPNWAILAGRLSIELIHEEIPDTFEKSTIFLEPILHPQYYKFVKEHGKELDKMIDMERDYRFNSFAIETLKKSYLAHLKMNDESILMESPQYMYMRVATYLHYPDIRAIKDTYDSLSLGKYSQATPTLFNSGLKRPQLSSCFLTTVSDDMDGITKAWHDQALISTTCGGLGCDYTNIRHSEIGQHGFSKGLISWLKITNEILKTVDQCFGPDTIVYTTKGPRRISDVTPGTKLVREDGSFGKVSKLLGYDVDRKKVDLYNFELQHSYEPVIVAGCHPMLSFKYKSGSGSFRDMKERLDEGKLTPEYTDIQYLNKDHFVGMPIPSYTRDIDYLTLQDCRFYGIMLGDGYINANRNEMKVYLNDTTKKDTRSFVEQYLATKGIKYWVNEKNNCKSYGWAPNPKTFPFTRKMLYKKDEKRICASMLNLPVEKSLQIFKGVMETDGSYRSDGEIQIEQSSKYLADGLRYMLLRCGIPTSGNVRDRVGSVSELKRGDTITTKKISYNLRIPKTPETCQILGREDPSKKLSYFIYDGKIWSRVKKNIILPDEVVVDQIYDIEMTNKENKEENANYLTSVGLAHNGGKRKGSGTIYIKTWHVDVYEFIELRDEGPEDMRAKDLFLALMISDLFVKRVRDNGDWSLFCPNKAKGLTEVWGDKFEELYEKYEKQGVASRVVKARDLWSRILNMQIKKGMPFIVYADACNSKSNQKHAGIIRSSNLCVEITLNTGPDEIASCTLASVVLSTCVKEVNGEKVVDYEEIERRTASCVRNLNEVIDRNFYPDKIPQIRYSNMRHRPLGIGVQGYADLIASLDLSWCIKNPHYEENNPKSHKYLINPKLKEVNEKVFEAMYYAAAKQSMELAKIYGHYESFPGSPASKGEFQFDMWGIQPHGRLGKDKWDVLRTNIMRHGLRNSTLLAIMPTASSAHILGNNEACEPFNELIYARTVLSGQFIVNNKHLVADLQDIGMWTDDVIKNIIGSKGSLQNVSVNVDDKRYSRLEHLKLKYLTAYEIPQSVLLELGADRGKYICQTESRNCFMGSPTKNMLHSYHMRAFDLGLKTSMYYLRQKARTDPINFSSTDKIIPGERKRRNITCVGDDGECMSCNA